MNINIHDVTSITLTKPYKLEGSGCFIRHIVLQYDGDHSMQVTLFADDPLALEAREVDSEFIYSPKAPKLNEVDTEE